MQSVSQRGDPGPSLIRDRTRHQPSWGDTIGATLSTAKCRGAVAPALQAAAKCLRLLWLGKAMDCRSNLRHGQCGAEQSADYFSKIDRSASCSSDLAGLSACAQTLNSSRKYLSLVSRLPLSCAACAAPYSERKRRGSFFSVASNCSNACARLIHLQQHLAEQLARRGQRPGRHRAFLRPIFQFRCRLHLPQCFLFLTRRQRSPCRDRKLLDFHLPRPVSLRRPSRGAPESAAALSPTRLPPPSCPSRAAPNPRANHVIASV